MKIAVNSAGTALGVGAGAGHPETYTKLAALNDATVKQMTEFKANQKKLNEGNIIFGLC